jgi:hypothetical protein
VTYIKKVLLIGFRGAPFCDVLIQPIREELQSAFSLLLIVTNLCPPLRSRKGGCPRLVVISRRWDRLPVLVYVKAVSRGRICHTEECHYASCATRQFYGCIVGHSI